MDKKEDLFRDFIRLADNVRHELSTGVIANEYSLLDLRQVCTAVSDLADQQLQTIQNNKIKQQSFEPSR